MVFWWREHHLSFEQECDYLKRLGFGIELWPTIRASHDCRYAKRNWNRLKHATEGMLVTLNSRNDGPTIDDWTEQIECAQMLGNAPMIATLESLCISDQLGIADWSFAKDVLDIARGHNVRISIETGKLSALMQVGDKFEDIYFCIDTGFINLDPDAPFTEYVDKLASRTTYVHLTDNYGVIDDHEPPGVDGGIPHDHWDYLLEALKKYDNEIIGALEMFPTMPGTMIKRGSDFLFDKMNWPGKPEAKVPYSHYRPV